MSLYTTMELMADLVMNNNDVSCDSVSVSSLKVWHLIPGSLFWFILGRAKGKLIGQEAYLI